jgi:hypothetical protein
MKRGSRSDRGLLREHMWKTETFEIISLLEKGKTPREIREIVKGARGDCIRRIAKRMGIKPFPAGTPVGIKDLKRLEAMKEMRANGATYDQIAMAFGRTRQAVHQLLTKHTK